MAGDITSIVQNLLKVKEDHDRTVDQLSEKLEKSCRLCLCEDSKQISLYTEVDDGIQYFQIANKFTDVGIECNDKLPTRICEECSSKLKLFHNFKKKCEKSRTDLETLYNLLYKISPAEQAKRQDEIVRRFEEQQKDGEENYEIVEVGLEDDVMDDDLSQMPNIEDEEYAFDQESNSFNVHLSEQGELSFSPLPVPEPDRPKVNRRGFSAISTTMRRDKFVTKTPTQTKIEEQISYVPVAEQKREQNRKSYAKKILLQNDSRSEVEKTSPKLMTVTIKTKSVNTNELLQDLTEITEAASLMTPRKIVSKTEPSKRKNLQVVKPRIKHEVGVAKKFKHNCDVCGGSYKLKSDFKEHILEAHGIVEKIECTLCGNKFARDAHLKLHMRIHNNQKPYGCDICEKRFIKSSDLSRHKKIHSDDKDYSCEVCQKKFKRLGDVKSHMRTHTGERPYSCQFCKKPFASHTSMKKHVIKNHGVSSTNESARDDEIEAE